MTQNGELQNPEESQPAKSAGKGKKNHRRNRRAKGNGQASAEEKIRKFEDINNKYMAYFTRKIKSLNRKINQCEKIDEKIKVDKEVQREELEMFKNKEKMLFAVSELEAMLLQIKKIAFEEKQTAVVQLREQKRQDDEVEQSFGMRAEKLQKELLQKKEMEKEKALKKKDEECGEKLGQIRGMVQSETAHFILELHFASEFIESLHGKEVMFLLEEMSSFLQTKASKLGEPFRLATEEDLHFFRSFMLQVFPHQSQIESVSSAKDEFANSTKMAHLLSIRSEDPIDGLRVEFSFRRMADIAEAISNSPLFYNRYPHSTLQFPQFDDSLAISEKAEEAPLKAETPGSLKEPNNPDKKSFVIPQNVPVSSGRAQQKKAEKKNGAKKSADSKPPRDQSRGRRGRGRGSRRAPRRRAPRKAEGQEAKQGPPKNAGAAQNRNGRQPGSANRTSSRTKGMVKSTFSKTGDGRVEAEL